jgi:hypothetical protein
MAVGGQSWPRWYAWCGSSGAMQLSGGRGRQRRGSKGQLISLSAACRACHPKGVNAAALLLLHLPGHPLHTTQVQPAQQSTNPPKEKSTGSPPKGKMPARGQRLATTVRRCRLLCAALWTNKNTTSHMIGYKMRAAEPRAASAAAGAPRWRRPTRARPGAAGTRGGRPRPCSSLLRHAGGEQQPTTAPAPQRGQQHWRPAPAGARCKVQCRHMGSIARPSLWTLRSVFSCTACL